MLKKCVINIKFIASSFVNVYKLYFIKLFMLYIKDGYPNPNEIVYCSVTKILGNTTFLNLEEYDKEGVLIISELAPGRIRSINEFVSVGKHIVCKVLKSNNRNNQIEVSLRRVSDIQKKNKIQEIRQEEFCKSIFIEVSKFLNKKYEDIFDRMSEEIFENYENVFECFTDISQDNTKINLFKKLDKNESSKLLEIINQKIKKEDFVIKKQFKIFNLDSSGVNIVKDTISSSLKNFNESDFLIVYLGNGTYEVRVTNKDKKSADKNLKSFLVEIENLSKKNNCEFKV